MPRSTSPSTPQQALDSAHIMLRAADSSLISTKAIVSAREIDKQRADSAARADSIRARRDTAFRRQYQAQHRAPTDSNAIAALRRSAELATMKPSKPIPVSDILISLEQPLTAGATYRVEAKDIHNLMGIAASSIRSFTVPKPTPPPPPPKNRPASARQPEAGRAEPRARRHLECETARMTELRPALFLDRDGTINVDTVHVSHPDTVRLIPGCGGGDRASERCGHTGDRGLESIRDRARTIHGGGVRPVRARIDELLAAEDAHVLATYYCPHSPDPEQPCECRKPGPALYRQAAAEHGLDLARSWYVGDRLRDIQPAKTFGGRGVLVPRDTTPGVDVVAARDGFAISTSLGAAVDRMLAALPLSSTPHSG